jgi:uncharacterized membrane protein required for colicin V production
MEVNWTIIAYFVIGFFAIAGFSRGWWKEALTTVVLAVLIFLLQNPDFALEVINSINDLIATVWGLIPDSITSVIRNGIDTVTVSSITIGAPHVDASDPGTWLTILALSVGGAILLSRVFLSSVPTPFGKVLGALMGGFNGFLTLGLVREYLDGRALPGRVVPTSDITLAGRSAFGPAAQTVSIQATELPGRTIMDSVIPWLLIGVGLLFLFSLFKTRVGLVTSADGGKIEPKVPPFYRKPPKKVAESRRRLFVEEQQ